MSITMFVSFFFVYIVIFMNIYVKYMMFIWKINEYHYDCQFLLRLYSDIHEYICYMYVVYMENQ